MFWNIFEDIRNMDKNLSKWLKDASYICNLVLFWAFVKKWIAHFSFSVVGICISYPNDQDYLPRRRIRQYS